MATVALGVLVAALPNLQASYTQVRMSVWMGQGTWLCCCLQVP